MISVASGLIKGLNLRSPQGDQTRPSSERLRQGTFNILRHYRKDSSENSDGSSILDGATVCDLFAGSGAWGIEALSNGAGVVQFVENHRLALHCLTQNLQIAARALKSQGLTPGLSRISQSVDDCYERLKPSHVLFADPPYFRQWFEAVLRLEEKYQKVLPQGLFLFESQLKEGVMASPEHHDLARRARLELFQEKNYGDSVVSFFVKR